ncbi:MAG: zinc ABC transporter solute-binding protein [Erysipelothrix sp.]|nr:zinc ABC transporter solute-binding protein [Erysipelothrix sp.]
MKKLYKILMLLTMSSLVLVGCTSKKIKVGYTVYPVKFLLEKIGGEKVETAAFSDETMVLRSQLATDYKEILKDADALFIMGELEPYMDIINQDIADLNPKIIDLSVKSGVFEFTRFTSVLIDNQKVDVKSNYYENPIFDSIDTYGGDPYLWLDPITMTSMANQVRDYLVSHDPDNTDYYNNNFDKLKIELAYLDANFLALRNEDNLRFATMTPSFGIWQNNYNFSISPIILSKYGVIPTQQQLELIKVRLINDGVKYLIVEEQMDQDIKDLADSLSKELNIEQVVLSSLSYRSKNQIDQEMNYIQIMNENLTILENLQKEGAEEMENLEDTEEDTTE